MVDGTASSGFTGLALRTARPCGCTASDMACSGTSGDGGELNEFERPGFVPGDLDPPSPPVVINTAEILKVRRTISTEHGGLSLRAER